jgi:hypothetical protein
MRAEFEVYSKEVVIKTRLGEKKFRLLPLSGRFYKKLMSVIKKFPQSEESEMKDILDALDEDTVGKLHELAFQTLKYSEKVVDEKDLENLDLFVSQNLFQLIPGIMEVNITPPEE